MDEREIWGLSPIEVHRDILDALALFSKMVEENFALPRKFLGSPHRTENEVKGILEIHDKERLRR